MKTKISRYAWGPTLFLLTILFACSLPPQAPNVRENARQSEEGKGGTSDIPGTSVAPSPSATVTQLPARFQSPSYTVGSNKEISDLLGTEEEFTVKVGADISSTSGPVVLRDIMKKLAALKNMNVSWASDVDQYSYVDVDIRADDDFFKSIDNLLRQRDYFHEVQGNTIVIKYKETKQFHLAIPFVKAKYDASVGSKVSTNSQSTISNSGNTFDIWENVQKNLDVVLQIWEDTSSSQTPPPASDGKTPSAPAAQSAGAAAKASDQPNATPKISRPQSGKGYYTIDKPIGLITVTAPRPIMEKVESYFNNMKGELYKQVSIEAKILTVTMNDSSSTGINWEKLLNNDNPLLNFSAKIGPINYRQPLGEGGIRTLSLSVPDFGLVVKAIETQGKTNTLANPRLSVLNGQPALINVGNQVSYIKQVTSTTDATTGAVTYTIMTDAISSGIVMTVVPIVQDNNEIILNLIPVISTLKNGTIPVQILGQNAQVGLPETNVMEMSTMVRVKQGEMLVVGGLIQSNDQNSDTQIPMLGRLPLIGKFFGAEEKQNNRQELVILLKPEIIS